MAKCTKSPCPTWQKLGLTLAFLLIVMASSAARALAEENFGIGAEVEIKVERATQQLTIVETKPDLVYMLASFIFGSMFTLLLVKIKTRRVTAATGALQGGEKLG